MLLLLLSVPALADISVRATLNQQRAQVGEQLLLTIEVNGAQNVSPPALSDIDGFDVQYVGPSTQISIVNGQMNASVQHRYALQPQRPGHFTLGPFAVPYQGKQYQTAALAVDVVAAGQPLPGQGAPDGSSQGPGPRALRLTLSLPQREVYLHERLPIDITLYVGSIRVADVQYPTLSSDGLSIDKFGEPGQTQQTINGETFQVLHFQTSIIPLRAGSLPLNAALQLSILNRRRGGGFNDPFFEHFFGDDPFNTERRPYTLRSEPVTLTVLPLPDEGKPPAFSGAVGSFSMQVSAAPTELTAGDPITMRIALTGSGNLGDAGPPALTSTDGFRIYEPHVAKADGGTKNFEQVLIPNDAGVHAVPPVRFSYFDPQARRYQTIESQPIALVVRPPPNAPHAEIMAGGVAVRPAIPEEKLGRDIVYIKDDPGRLAAPSDAWYRSLPFALWQPLPLLLFGAAVWYDRRRQRLSGDIRYARFTRAGKHARAGLAAAEQALAQGNREAFYDAVSRTMQAYLGAKLDLPPGGIDADAAGGRGIPEDCAQRLREFFATCERVRFAPDAGDGDMRGTLALAQEVIRRLERERRLTPRTAAPVSSAALVLLAVACGSVARAADAPPASPQTTFFHANALYKDGQYDAAAREYEELLHGGLTSGNLYFNLGNAYFKAGAQGKAILNYERARRLMPNDPDVAANLAYAQSLTGAEACPPPLWQRLAFPAAHRFAPGGLIGLTSLAYTLLLISLTVYRLWTRRPRWLAYTAVALGILLLVSGTSLAHQMLGDEWYDQAVIVGDGETPARFEPAESGTVHFALKEGSLVSVLDRRDGWLQIARCDGRRGWVPSTSVENL